MTTFINRNSSLCLTLTLNHNACRFWIPCKFLYGQPKLEQHRVRNFEKPYFCLIKLIWNHHTVFDMKNIATAVIKAYYNQSKTVLKSCLLACLFSLSLHYRLYLEQLASTFKIIDQIMRVLLNKSFLIPTLNIPWIKIHSHHHMWVYLQFGSEQLVYYYRVPGFLYFLEICVPSVFWTNYALSCFYIYLLCKSLLIFKNQTQLLWCF